MLIKEVDRNPIDLSNRVRGFEPVNEGSYYKVIRMAKESNL